MSTVVEVVGGVGMAGPNLLAGLDAGGTELGEGVGRVVYGEDAGDRMLGGLQILSGLGKGAEVTLQVMTMKRSWNSGTINRAGQTSTLRENKTHGDAFRDKSVGVRSTPWRESVNEVTIRPNVGHGKPGTKADNFRIDTLERSLITGEFKLVECKGTSTADFTAKQTPGFANFEKYGGEVVGKGKGFAPGGTVLPPSGVKVVRPLGQFVEVSVTAATVQSVVERKRLDDEEGGSVPPSDHTDLNSDLGDITIFHPGSVVR